MLKYHLGAVANFHHKLDKEWPDRVTLFTTSDMRFSSAVVEGLVALKDINGIVYLSKNISEPGADVWVHLTCYLNNIPDSGTREISFVYKDGFISPVYQVGWPWEHDGDSVDWINDWCLMRDPTDYDKYFPHGLMQTTTKWDKELIESAVQQWWDHHLESK